MSFGFIFTKANGKFLFAMNSSISFRVIESKSKMSGIFFSESESATIFWKRALVIMSNIRFLHLTSIVNLFRNSTYQSLKRNDFNSMRLNDSRKLPLVSFFNANHFSVLMPLILHIKILVIIIYIDIIEQNTVNLLRFRIFITPDIIMVAGRKHYA